MCNVLLIEEGNIREVRAIRLTVDSFIDGLKTDFSEIAEWRLSSLDEEEPIATDRLFRRLVKELQRTLFGVEVREIIVCGDPQLTQGLPEFLYKYFHIPANHWNLSQGIDIAENIDSSILSLAPTAIGLAI